MGEYLCEREVERLISGDFVDSIENLMDAVKGMRKGVNTGIGKRGGMGEVYKLAEEVGRREGSMIRCRETYESAWEGMEKY